MPDPGPGGVDPFPYDLTPLEPTTQPVSQVRPAAPVDSAKPAPAPAPLADEPVAGEPATAKRKRELKEREKQRRRAILAGRGYER